MKKLILSILIVIVAVAAVSTFAACNKGEELTLYVPDGAPAMSVAKIINDGSIGGSDFGSQKVTTFITMGEDVTAKCGSGEADMAILPTNAAVKICSANDNYKIFSVNVYGVLYVVGREPIESVNDLVDGQSGKLMYSIGLGNTPEYVFKTICDNKNIEYLEADSNNHYGKLALRYFSDASEILPLFLKGEADYALVGEPAATQLVNALVAKGLNPGTLDLQTLWKEVTNSEESGYPQASLIVKQSLLQDSSFQKRLTKSLAANSDFVEEHASELKGILQSAGSSLQVDFTAEIIQRCHLSFTDAYQVKSDIETYLGKFTGMSQFLPLDQHLFVGELSSDE